MALAARVDLSADSQYLIRTALGTGEKKKGDDRSTVAQSAINLKSEL